MSFGGLRIHKNIVGRTKVFILFLSSMIVVAISMILAAIHTYRVTTQQSYQADKVVQQFLQAQRILYGSLDTNQYEIVRLHAEVPQYIRLLIVDHSVTPSTIVAELKYDAAAKEIQKKGKRKRSKKPLSTPLRLILYDSSLETVARTLTYNGFNVQSHYQSSENTISS